MAPSLVGCKVSGFYRGNKIKGFVKYTKVNYYGEVLHFVDLLEPIKFRFRTEEQWVAMVPDSKICKIDGEVRK